MELSPQAKHAFQAQSYAARPVIEGVQIVELERHPDDGGSMTELARLVDGTPEALAGFTVRQINFSEVEPGAIKAFHLHARQTDVWFVPPSDRFLLVLADVRKGSRTSGRRARRAQPGTGRGPDHLLHRRPLLPQPHGLRRRPPALGLPRRRRLGHGTRLGG
jgi:dTDP-4-dehydrorhamnose 3,5-epimerase